MKPFLLFSFFNTILFCYCASLWGEKYYLPQKKTRVFSAIWPFLTAAALFFTELFSYPFQAKLILFLFATALEIFLIYRVSAIEATAFSFIFTSSLSLAELLFVLVVRIISGVDFSAPENAFGAVLIRFLAVLGALCLAGVGKKKREAVSSPLKGFLKISLCACFLFLLENVKIILSKSTATDGTILGFFFFLLAVTLVYSLFLSHLHKESQAARLSAEMAFYDRYLSETKEHLQAVSKIHHDFKKHLRVLEAILPNEPDRAKEYLSQISADFQGLRPICFTGSPAVDATLSRYQKDAEELGISLAIHAQYPSDCKISDKDICAVLFNILDNAVKGTAAAKGTEIDFSMKIIHSSLVIKCTNPCSETKKSTPSLFHGHGLKIIQSVAERYSGSMQAEKTNGIFKILVYLCP